jgi:hypothetical protein
VQGMITTGSTPMTRDHERLERQFDKLEDLVPGLKGRTGPLRSRGAVYFRVPLGIFLVLGGMLAFLPFLGLWMIPMGLLLLAIDLPFLRPHVNAAIIRGRRKAELLRRRWWPKRSG